MDVCAQHIHAKPEPPSARLERPVPVDLERIVLSCLAKAPDERPASASALRDMLDACACAGRWSASAAEAWWKVHDGKIRARRSGEPLASPSAPTVRVALERSNGAPL